MKCFFFIEMMKFKLYHLCKRVHVQPALLGGRRLLQVSGVPKLSVLLQQVRQDEMMDYLILCSPNAPSSEPPPPPSCW